jgi:hypothetical protein
MRTDFGPFLAWSEARGISTPLELVSDGSYRYMALPPNKEDLLAQSKSPEMISIVTAPLDACLVGDDWQTLVERLTYESGLGDKSDMAPWLDLFPTLEDFSGMPRFWKPERREMVRKYDGGQLEVRMDMDKLRFDQVDDQWALACVDSRSNFLPDKTYGMTPVLDMLNHDASVKTSARVDGAERLLLEVNKESVFKTKEPSTDWKDQVFGLFGGGQSDYQPGAELFVSYGAFDNLETLCNYGFVSVNSPTNIESIRVRAMGKASQSLVVDSKGTIDNIYNQISLTDLRVNLATQEELESLEDYSGLGPISDKNEIEVFALIAGELEEALYDAEKGAEEAEAINDDVVASYLRGRCVTLTKGRKWLMKMFPDVF